MIGIILISIISIVIIYAFCKWITSNYDYFEKKGITHLKPIFLLGNTAGLFFKKYNTMEFISLLYNKFPNEKIMGLFDFQKPFLLVRDPDVIKQLAVKDFDYFTDHRSFFEENVDRLFGNSLFLLRGQKWRDMRATLSPAFTGSKMRQMFELVTECAEDMSKFYVKEGNSGKRINLEMKETFSRITNDIIASCAFGIKVDSFKNPNNEFYNIAKYMADFRSIRNTIKLILLRIIPKLMKLLDIELIDKKVGNFFKSMVMDNIETRMKEGIFRPDMINIIMELKKGQNLNENVNKNLDKISADGFATVEESNIGKMAVSRQWSDDELVAQCFLFFAAGFDTSSTLLSFAAYELATNLDIQQRLYEEICDVNVKLNGKRITYEVLQKMQYMDMVISEALRKWPPAPLTDRVCNKDYQYDDGELSFTFNKGLAFWIPIYGIHHDPKYYPNPDKFVPERFSEENRENINIGAYVPFGVGPRNCIGSRFALMQVKAIIYYILLNFELVPNEKTDIPIKLSKSPLVIAFQNGMNLEIKLRK